MTNDYIIIPAVLLWFRENGRASYPVRQTYVLPLAPRSIATCLSAFRGTPPPVRTLWAKGSNPRITLRRGSLFCIPALSSEEPFNSASSLPFATDRFLKLSSAKKNMGVMP